MGSIKNRLSAWFSDDAPPARAPAPAPRPVVDAVEVAPVRSIRHLPPLAPQADLEEMIEAAGNGLKPPIKGREDVDTGMEQIKQAHALLRDGALTEQEFAQIKAQLILRMGAPLQEDAR